MKWKIALFIGAILCGIIVNAFIFLWWTRSIDNFNLPNIILGASLDEVDDIKTDLNGNFITLDHIELSEKNKEQHTVKKCTELIKQLKLVDVCSNVHRSEVCGAYYTRQDDGYASCETIMVDSVKTCEPKKMYCK